MAHTLGRTLQELGDTMTAEEFGLWAAEYDVRPWGEERADLRAGIVASVVANYAGRMRKDGNAAKPADFMPFREQQEPEIEDDPMDHFRSL